MARQKRPANTLPRPQVGPSNEDLLMAEAGAAGSFETEEGLGELVGEESESLEGIQHGSVTHTTPGLVQVYKEQANGDWLPRLVPRKSLTQAITDGARANCPFCDTRTCDGLNGCTAREKRAVMLCPVCSKKFVDVPRMIMKERTNLSEADRDMIIEADDKEQETLASVQARLKSRRDIHIAGFHEETARAMGITLDDAMRPRPQVVPA